MESLGKLFGSIARVKLLRLFIFNHDISFSVDEAAKRSKVAKELVRKELNALLAARVIKKRTVKRKAVYQADRRFPHYDALATFLRTSAGVSDTRVTSALKKTGILRLIVLSGMFAGIVESPVDILIVGDRLEERQVARAVRSLEAELGRELRYASFTTADFRYRIGIYDRLVRDVFDYPHRTVLDRIGM